MINPRPISSGKNYSSEYLSQPDSPGYYTEGGKVEGKWFGERAEELGLDGVADPKQLDPLMQGTCPVTKQKLRMRDNKAKKDANGNPIDHPRSGHDLCITAPKDLSILYALGGRDPRLLEAHERANKAALDMVMGLCVVRDKKSGAYREIPCKVMGASFTHFESRHLDPLIHTHNFLANTGFVDGKYRTLYAQRIYSQKKLIDAVYRSKISEELMKLGFELERIDGGKNLGIKGVTHEMRDAFSNGSKLKALAIKEEGERREKIISEFQGTGASDLEKYLADRGEKWAHLSSKKYSDAEIAHLLRQKRPQKKKGLTVEFVEKTQIEKAGEKAMERVEMILANAREKEVDTPSDAQIDRAIIHAVEHLLERKSVTAEKTLLEEALDFCIDAKIPCSMDRLKSRLATAEKSGSVIISRDAKGGEASVTTRAALDAEEEMFAHINRRGGQFEELACEEDLEVLRKEEEEAKREYDLIKGKGDAEAENNLGSTKSQKHAIKFVLASKDRCVHMEGAAGAGKTYTLTTIHEYLQKNGRKVLGVAPSSSATEELDKAGIGSTTIAMLLANPKQQEKIKKGDVLILDEAGMVSTKQMNSIMRLAEKNEWRVVLCGDTKQIQSVEAGDALSLIKGDKKKRYTILKTVSLLNVRRQEVREYREAIVTLRDDVGSGFEKLDKMGCIEEVKDAEKRAARVAEKYFEERDKPNAKKEKSSVLVVCPTHAEIDRISAAIRYAKKNRGEIKADEEFEKTTHRSLNLTVAQRRQISNYSEGMVVRINRDIPGATKGGWVKIEKIEDGMIIGRDSKRGNEVRINPAQKASSIDLCTERTIQISKGEQIMLTRSGKLKDGSKISNGAIEEVSQVCEDGSMVLKSGKTLSSSFVDFTYSYAITAHKSQGKSVTSVIVSGAEMPKELFYVAASRGRERLSIVTGEKEVMLESAKQSQARESATAMVLGDNALRSIQTDFLNQQRERLHAEELREAAKKMERQKHQQKWKKVPVQPQKPQPQKTQRTL